jgi:hypothetical protein
LPVILVVLFLSRGTPVRHAPVDVARSTPPAEPAALPAPVAGEGPMIVPLTSPAPASASAPAVKGRHRRQRGQGLRAKHAALQTKGLKPEGSARTRRSNARLAR